MGFQRQFQECDLESVPEDTLKSTGAGSLARRRANPVGVGQRRGGKEPWCPCAQRGTALLCSRRESASFVWLRGPSQRVQGVERQLALNGRGLPRHQRGRPVESVVFGRSKLTIMGGIQAHIKWLLFGGDRVERRAVWMNAGVSSVLEIL